MDKKVWFEMAADGGRLTRTTADPDNFRIPAAWLEVSRNFFSQCVPEEWNRIPPELNQAKSATAFRYRYREYRRAATAAVRTEP